SRRRHTSFSRDWSSDVCSSDLLHVTGASADLLASGTLAANRGEEIRQAFDVRGDTARLTLEARSRSVIPLDVGRGARWELQLTRSEERRVGKACSTRWDSCSDQ